MRPLVRIGKGYVVDRVVGVGVGLEGCGTPGRRVRDRPTVQTIVVRVHKARSDGVRGKTLILCPVHPGTYSREVIYVFHRPHDRNKP